MLESWAMMLESGAAALATAEPDPAPERLVAYIIDRYHRTHRREFAFAVRTAQIAEQLYPTDPIFPRGLAAHLARMADELETHHQREEQTLFPLVARGVGPLPISLEELVCEHAEVEVQLEKLDELTAGLRACADAPPTWRALVQVCRKLDHDLREHLRLEREVLFAPYLQ
jgi:regulator of cell morphogenesis and NO signaling